MNSSIITLLIFLLSIPAFGHATLNQSHYLLADGETGIQIAARFEGQEDRGFRFEGNVRRGSHYLEET